MNVAVAAIDRVDDARQFDGQIGHAERMSGGGRIALLDGRDRGGDKPFEQPLDRFVEQIVLDRHRRLRGKGAHQLDGLVIERNDLRRHRRSGQFRRRAELPAVDELEHADQLADVRDHRKDQHRTCEYPFFSSNERLIEYSASVGERLGVVDDQRLAGQGHRIRPGCGA